MGCFKAEWDGEEVSVVAFRLDESLLMTCVGSMLLHSTSILRTCWQRRGCKYYGLDERTNALDEGVLYKHWVGKEHTLYIIDRETIEHITTQIIPSQPIPAFVQTQHSIYLNIIQYHRILTSLKSLNHSLETGIQQVSN